MAQYDYNLIVVGGGSAGLTAAEVAAVLGLRVALIEGRRIGGDCTWTGCVPSKAFIASARRAYEMRHSDAWGIHAHDIQIDFPAVMARLHTIIDDIYQEEAPDVLRGKGIDVYEQYATFHDEHTLALADGSQITGRYILLATGAKSIIPDGLRDLPYLTHETLFDLQALPHHLLIVGGGYIGAEMGQAFRRLGSEVTIITRADRLLSEIDEEARALLCQQFNAEGIRIITGREIMTGYIADNRDIVLEDMTGTTYTGTHVLIATDKSPDIRAMKPENADITTTPDGAIIIDTTLRTSQKHIYVAGDVAGGAQFTHTASSQATTALLNILSPYKTTGIIEYAPYAIFTSPEIAQAGMTEAQARATGRADVHITRMPMTGADRAMTDGTAQGKPTGFVKLIHRANGRLLGATIVGKDAGEMMNEWAQLIAKGGMVRDVALSVHIYPTLSFSNMIVATEQLRKQVASGHWVGRTLQRFVRLRMRA